MQLPALFSACPVLSQRPASVGPQTDLSLRDTQEPCVAILMLAAAVAGTAKFENVPTFQSTLCGAASPGRVEGSFEMVQLLCRLNEQTFRVIVEPLPA